MRNYEIIFIVRPDLPEEDADKLLSQMENLVTSTGGTVKKMEKLGRRRLAYKIKRCQEGLYVLFVLDCQAATVHEFERKLKVSDPVIKFMTVRLDEEMKKVEKFRQSRAKRTARRKAPPAAEAAAAAS